MKRHVLIPGAEKHRNTGTLRNTPENSGTPEHPGTPEQPKNPGTPNLTVLVCFPVTDHVKKWNVSAIYFPQQPVYPHNTKELKAGVHLNLIEILGSLKRD